MAPERRRGSGGRLLSSDAKGLAETWRRGGPFWRGEPLPGWKGLCKSPIQGWALCLPQSPALPLPHICTPPTATWRDRWLLPGLGCQLKLLNKVFAKSTPCSSGSPWLIEERPSSSSVFLDNVSSPSSLTHNALFQATFIIPHTCLGHRSVPATLFYAGSSFQAFAVAAPHPPPLTPRLECPSFNQPQCSPTISASRSRLIALSVGLAPVLH